MQAQTSSNLADTNSGHSWPHSLQYLSLRKSCPEVNRRPVSPKTSIHHLALDAISSTFYSLPIFDALAPPAIPVAVTKRTLCAATNRPLQLIEYSQPFGPAVNPASSDGGQHTT